MLAASAAFLRPPAVTAQDQAPPRIVAIDSAAIEAGAAAITEPELRRLGAALVQETGGQPARGQHTLDRPTLERRATALAAELRQAGVVFPTGFVNWPDDSTLLHRYPFPGSLTPNFAGSAVSFRVKVPRDPRDTLAAGPQDTTVNLFLHSDARFAADTLLQANFPVGGEIVLLTGRHTAATVRAAAPRDGSDVYVYVPPPATDSATRQAVVAALNATNYVVLVSDEDSATFARRRAAQEAKPPVVMEQYTADLIGHPHWAVAVSPTRMAEVLALPSLRLDLAQLRAETAPTVRRLPAIAELRVRANGVPRPADSAVNVVGVLTGTDSTSRVGILPMAYQLVVVLARLDTPDAAALVALAKALNQPGTRPRRGVLFAAVSGTAAHNVGARAFAQAYGLGSIDAPVAVGLALDHLGAPPRDTLIVDGLRDVEFARPIERQMTKHGELNVLVVDGGTVVRATSDHIGLLTRRVPTLRLHGGADSSASAFDADLATRQVRLVYHIVQQLANELAWPKWTADARARRRQLLGTDMGAD